MNVQQMRDVDNAFYARMFIETSYWSTPYPNSDEAARWGKIVTFVSQVVHEYGSNEAFKILDLGCGRGWLTNLLADFGQAEGIDPVPDVISAGSQLFPHLRLSAGIAETILSRENFIPYNLVVTSEVIEHVPYGEKQVFMQSIYRLLDSEGHLILTTPRGKLWRNIEKHAKSRGSELQPVEDWVREKELAQLFTQQGFRIRQHTRAFPVPRGGKLTWRLWRSTKLAAFLGMVGLESARAILEYSLSKYQIWWVQKA